MTLASKLATSWRLVTAPRVMVMHAAAALDGKSVLVVGGTIPSAGDKTAADAHIFNPAKGEWKQVAPMQTSRSGHTATTLLDGRVLVAGGQTFIPDQLIEDLDSSELFDPATLTWAQVPSSIGARHNLHTATRLEDGRVLVMGGEYDGYLKAVDLYDPIEGPRGTWVEAPWFIGGGRSHHTATLLSDGDVLVTGGRSSFGPTNTSIIYSLADDGWVETGSLGHAREYHTATLLSDGRVLVVGGNNVDYMPIASAELFGGSAFEEAASMQTSRTNHTAALLPDGRVLVVGGRDQQQQALATTSIYDPGNDSWSAGPDLNQGRYQHTMTMLAGSVVVIGGLDTEGNVLASAEVLDLGEKLGSACTADDECSSGSCADGVCCDTSCDNACEACTAALKGSGTDGTCGPAKDGTNPRNVCSEDQVCSQGQCQAAEAGCEGQIDGTACGKDDGCVTGLCRDQVCITTHKLDGTRCEGGVCIAGECKQDRTPGGADGGHAGGSSGEDGGTGDPSEDDGKGSKDLRGKEVKSICSAAPSSSRSPSSMTLVMGILAALGIVRRRSRNYDEANRRQGF